jgi:hypothetical protein
LAPALRALKLPPKTEACPEALAPQQTTLPLVLTPQLWLAPALIAMNVPVGDVVWPEAFEPQQARVPFVLTPQLSRPH